MNNQPCYPFDPVEALMIYIDTRKLYNLSLTRIKMSIAQSGSIGIAARLAQHPLTATVSYHKWVYRARIAVQIYRNAELQEQHDLEWQWGDAVAYAHCLDFNFDAFDYESELYPLIKQNSSLFEIIQLSANKPVFVSDFG